MGESGTMADARVLPLLAFGAPPRADAEAELEVDDDDEDELVPIAAPPSKQIQEIAKKLKRVVALHRQVTTLISEQQEKIKAYNDWRNQYAKKLQNPYLADIGNRIIAKGNKMLRFASMLFGEIRSFDLEGTDVISKVVRLTRENKRLQQILDNYDAKFIQKFRNSVKIAGQWGDFAYNQMLKLSPPEGLPAAALQKILNLDQFKINFVPVRPIFNPTTAEKAKDILGKQLRDLVQERSFKDAPAFKAVNQFYLERIPVPGES